MVYRYNYKEYKKWGDEYIRNKENTLNRLRNINKYFKQYLFIMMACSNRKLHNDIYDIIIEKLNQDLMNLYNNIKISTLAKWLPRENSSFDRELDFVNKITKKMYPGLPPNRAKQLYRKNIVKLTAVFDIVETKLCNKQIDDIDFKKVPLSALKRYSKVFSQNSNRSSDYVCEVMNRLLKMSDKKFVDTLIEWNVSRFETSLIKNAFIVRKNKILKENSYLSKQIPVLDVTINFIKHKYFYKYMLQTLALAEKTNVVVAVGDENYVLQFEWNTTLQERYKKILACIGHSKRINITGLNKKYGFNGFCVFSDKYITSNRDTKYIIPTELKTNSYTFYEKIKQFFV